MRMRSELMIAIRQVVAEWGITQAATARRVEVTHPRLYDLLRGRINNFSLDALTCSPRAPAWRCRCGLSERRRSFRNCRFRDDGPARDVRTRRIRTSFRMTQ